MFSISSSLSKLFINSKNSLLSCTRLGKAKTIDIAPFFSSKTIPPFADNFLKNTERTSFETFSISKELPIAIAISYKIVSL